MATYVRQTGTNEVYDVSSGTKRYVSYDEAVKNNIWAQVQDVASLAQYDAPAPSATPVSAPAPFTPVSQLPTLGQPPAPAPKPAPKPAATITPEVKPYIRNPSGLDVYDRQGNYISAEKAATIPGFWDQVEITASAPNTSKGAGLGGPVSGLNNGLGYITYNGIDVYEKSTGKYIDFDTAKKLDIWNKIETVVDTQKLEDLGIDPTGETPQFKNEDLKKEYKTTISPYQQIYNDFKVAMEKMNDKLEQAWTEYNLAVIEIEENPWLLTGEATQELNKLKKKSMAKINALTSAKSNMLDEFNLAVGITEKTVSWEEAQKKLTPEEESALALKEYETKLQLGKKYETPKEIESWSEPYNLGGDIVQKNLKTGEIRTAVNVASGKSTELSQAEKDQRIRDESFEKFVKDMAAKVYAKELTREKAKAQIKTLFPEYDENVIYDLVPDDLDPFKK